MTFQVAIYIRADQSLDTAEMPMEMGDLVTDPAELQGRLQPAPGPRPEITPYGEFFHPHGATGYHALALAHLTFQPPRQIEERTL